MKKRLLVTGSNGLIGSEMVRHFYAMGWEVHGVDNNMRADFFGPQGDTRWNQRELLRQCEGFTHHELDIRHRDASLSWRSRSGPTRSFTRPRSRVTTWPPSVRSTISMSTLAAR